MVKRNSTCTWLEQKQHFHTPEYARIFQAYYDRKLQEKEYVAAAEALEIVANQEMYYASYDSTFRVTLQSFGEHYRDRLPPLSATFLDSYMGYYYSEQSDFRRAIPYFERIVRTQPVDYKSCENIAYGYSNMAYCYSSVGDQKTALQKNLKALDYFNRINDSRGKNTVYVNLYLVHVLTKNFRQSELYIDRALTNYQRQKDTTNVVISLLNKIGLYEDMEHPGLYPLIDSTYRYFTASGLIDPSLKISVDTYYCKKLLRDGRPKEALKILDGLEESVRTLNSPFSEAEYIVARAEYELATSQGIPDVALIERALAIVEENEHYQTQLAYCEVLKHDAILKHDYRRALFFSEKTEKASGLLATEQMMIKTAELDQQYQAVKRQQQIGRQRTIISNSKTTIALLLSLLTALFLAATIVFLRQKQKKIRSENRRVQLYTKQLLEKTEEERKRIASDLHDSVSHELLNLKHAIGENSDASGDRIDLIIRDIRSISRNLHPVMFEKVGLTASIDQLIERAQSLNDLMVTADIAYSGSLSVSDELQVYRIIQEALSNIIKYAEAVAAKIIIREEPTEFQIQIKDNGTGFNVNETLSGGDAFGLHNIIERSKAIGGSARITSDKNGTIITIDLKKIR